MGAEGRPVVVVAEGGAVEERLKVELLGQFRVRVPTRELRELDTPRLRALLGRLVLAEGRAVDRAELAFSFWPDSTETRARGNLRKLLHFLSQRLPEFTAYVDVADRSLAWRADAQASVDVTEFERLAGSEHLADWRRAAALYAGPLLPGSYEEWVLEERARLEGRFGALLGRLADACETRGEFAQAAAAVERQLRAAPYAEETWARLIRLHAAAGERAQALAAYERFRRALEEEFGVEPDGEIAELHARLLAPAGGLARQPGRGAQAVAPRPRVIGRHDENRRLRGWAHAALAAARPTLLMVEGEAGLGKTALAEELAAWARDQGHVVHWGQAYEPDREIAFAPVRYLLRDRPLLEAARAQPAAWRSELARLVPEIEPGAAAPAAARDAAEWRRQQLFAALSGLLSAAGRPLLLVADDLQWWDGASLAWLHALLAGAERRPLVVLATLRPEEEGPEPLPALLASLEARGALERLELGPLGAAATAQLLAELAQERVPDEEAARAYAETEGNPLFIVEWAQALRAGVTAEARSYESFLDPLTGLPRRVHGLIMGRLLALSAEARRVAEAGAVLGRSFGWALLHRMAEEADLELVDALEELCRRRVLREHPARPQEEGSYDFAHGRIRDVVEARLSAARRRFLHERAVGALLEVYGDDERYAAQRGEHLAQAGRPLQAARQFARAAQDALAVYANQQAITHHRRALELLAAGQEGGPLRADARAGGAAGERAEVRAEAAEGLGEALHLVGRHAEAAAAFAAAAEAAALLPPEPMRRARLLRKRGDAERDAQQHEAAERHYDEAERLVGGAPPGPAGAAARMALLEVKFERLDLYYRAGRQPEMAGVVSEMAPLVEGSADPSVRTRYHHTLALLAHRRNRFVPAADELHHARETLAAARLTGDPHELAAARFGLGFVQLWAGELEAALDSLEAGLEGAVATGNLLLEVRALTYLGVSQRLLGEAERALALARRAGELADRGGLREYAAASHAQAAWVAQTRGQRRLAREEGERALALWAEGAAAFPFRWLAAFPLLGVALQERDLEAAAALARTLLEPDQQRLPEETEQALLVGLAAWRTGDAAEALPAFERALELAPGANPPGHR